MCRLSSADSIFSESFQVAEKLCWLEIFASPLSLPVDCVVSRDNRTVANASRSCSQFTEIIQPLVEFFVKDHLRDGVPFLMIKLSQLTKTKYAEGMAQHMQALTEDVPSYLLQN